MATNGTLEIEVLRTSQEVYPCAVQGRVVPSGAVGDNLRLSLLLSPDPCDVKFPYQVDADGRLDIRTWPSDLMKRLRGADVRVDVIPVPMVAPSDPRPHPDNLPLTAPVPAKAPGLNSINRREFIALDQLWQASLQPQSDSDPKEADPNQPKVVQGIWGDLMSSLRQTQQGTATAAGRIAEGEDIVPAKNNRFGTDGQLERSAPDPDAQVDGIMDVPHADLALALEFQRAEELRISLMEGCGNLGVRKAAEQAALDRIATKVPTPAPTGTDRLDITGMAPEEAELARKERIEKDKAALAEELKQRKIAQHGALARDLAANRDEARRAFLAEKDAGGAQTCADVPGAPGWAPNLRAHDAADGDKREAQLDKLTGAHSYATWPQYTDQTSIKDADANKVDPPAPNYVAKKIVQTFFSIQSNPVLSRAFGLTVDLEIDANALRDRMGGALFCYLSVDLSALADAGCITPVPARVWTLAKLQKRGSRWHFWPATEEEMLDHVSCSNRPRRCYLQYDGVMMMGEGSSTNPEKHAPRFDVTGIDIRTATEMERQRRETRQANIASAKAYTRALQQGNDPAKGSNDNRTWDDLAFGAKMQTAGLTLMCRSQKVDTARVLARRYLRSVDQAGSGATVLDANDLTTGFRLLLGTPKGKDDFDTEWRPLMNRLVEYETSGRNVRKMLEDRIIPSDRGPDRVDTGVLTKLIGKAGSVERLALESAYLSVPNRLLPTGDADDATVEAVVEQAIAVWNGDPMGVDCTPTGAFGPTVEDTMSFGRELTLPDRFDKGIAVPQPLRYGMPYRLAMVVVYSGGHSVPVDELPEETTPDVGDCLYYPPKALADGGTQPYFRALRHDKLAAPQVLLPVGHATRSFTADTRGRPRRLTGDAGPMGFEHGRKMVIRSLIGLSGTDQTDARLQSRALPDLAQRIVLVPNLPLDDVIRHGAYDENSTTRQPPGDLRDVALSRDKRESFPVTQTRSKRGVSNRYYVERRDTQDTPNATVAGPELALGDPVFGPGNGRDSRVFPDPAADTLVIGLRRKGENTYLPGGPVQVPLQPGASYPGQRPVVITLTAAADPTRSRPQKVMDVITGDPTAIRFDPTRRGNILTASGGWQGNAFTLALAPGEAYEVDLWCAPSAARLAREFALIQSLGMLLAQSVKPDVACNADAILKAARVSLPATATEALAEKLADCNAADLLGYVGPGGIAAPSNRVLKSLAEVVHQVLLCHPMPEIAGKVTMDAIHACNRTPFSPVVNPLADPATALNAAMVTPATLKGQSGGLLPLAAQRPKEPKRIPVLDNADQPISPADQPPASGSLRTVDEGSTHLQLSGEVEIDLNANDSVEIIAKTVLPGTAIFDDRNRGRSMAYRRAGVWPKQKTADGQIATDPEGNPRHRPAQDVYGFRLAPDGRVTLEEFEVTLLRIEGLEAVPGAGRTRLDLRPYFEEIGHGPARVTYRHIFPDGKARLMQVRASALSRTAEMMATVNRVARSDDPWATGQGLIYRGGEMVPGEAVPPEHQANPSGVATVILPATIRPAKCDARAPVPVFDWAAGDSPRRGRRATWVRRGSVIRIPLGREWFSSGQDEKLGLVLWPPEMPLDPLEPSDYVDMPGATPDARNRTVKLPTFEDDDLGPGGAFITRMGADPLRGGRDQTRTFLSLDDFPDLRRDADHVSHAEYVPAVDMPLSDPEDTEKGEETPPLRVGLLTYAPRFDPDAEEWYVDVSLAPGMAPESFVRFGLVRYQPHTVPGLRCSRPVTQWVQPMPDRYVVAQRAAAGAEADLTLRVSGPAFERRAVSPSLHADSRALVQSPLMQVTVFEEIETPDGSAKRFVLAQPDGQSGVPIDTLQVVPTFQDGIARWSLDLRQSDLDVRPDARIKLLIEEVEMYEPATYAEEPVEVGAMSNWNKTLLPSGPRFVTTLDVTALVADQTPVD